MPAVSSLAVDRNETERVGAAAFGTGGRMAYSI